MTWRTVFELRILVFLDAGPVSWVEHFDALEPARERFTKAADNVRESVGLRKSFATSSGNELTGVVQRGVVEIVTGRLNSETNRASELRVMPDYSVVIEPPTEGIVPTSDAGEAGVA